jgi:membrane protease subunit (stomatin/prohibitin family)
LGATRLDELLAAESEEAIRNFVHSVRLSQVQDIKAEIAQTMLGDLNAKFNKFGVYFENVSIMYIKIPNILSSALSETTQYDINLQNQLKRHGKNISITPI